MNATTKTVKPVNYTEEQAARMALVYGADKKQSSVELLALELGKTTRSIIAKLSRMKSVDGDQLYVKPEYKTKAGTTVVKKEGLIDDLAKLVGSMSEAEQSSFDHVNKSALVKLIAALTPKVTQEG
jgi:hypothetical protein